jgi:hypothetical protein
MSTGSTQTWLQKAGTAIRSILHIGIEAAEVAEPAIDISVPAVGALYNGTVGLFVSAEAAFGAAPGQGEAKLASALPAIVDNVEAWAKANGCDVVEEDVEKWASAFADTLNLLPVVKSTAATTDTAA